MVKNINIIDKDYKQWVKLVALRYRNNQIKAAIKVNTEQLKFYWELGKDIVEKNVEKLWGEGVIAQLSKDLKKALPGIDGLSITNIYYCRKFYLLYPQKGKEFPQVEGKTENFPQVGGIFEIPWGHHKVIMDKVKGDNQKAMFYVIQTIQNGWSRSTLLNWIGTGLYERQGKALNNFKQKLPQINSDLAKEITKDPYCFGFAEITGKYNERKLKDALLKNISDFLIELGTGFAYVGKEYRLEIGETENFIDLLFYNLRLRCYVVIEVKIDKFEPKDIGQIGTYITAVNHILREEAKDNPTIGLLICKNKDNTLAQYALESSSQPIGISEYELEKFYPVRVEGTIPTISEIEAALESKSVENK